MVSIDGEAGSKAYRVISYTCNTPAVNLRVTIRLNA
jgi:hypothetical protein